MFRPPSPATPNPTAKATTKVHNINKKWHPPNLPLQLTGLLLNYTDKSNVQLTTILRMSSCTFLVMLQMAWADECEKITGASEVWIASNDVWWRCGERDKGQLWTTSLLQTNILQWYFWLQLTGENAYLTCWVMLILLLSRRRQNHPWCPLMLPFYRIHIYLFPGLVNFVPAVAYHFCLNLPAEFSQPGNSLTGIPCRLTGYMTTYMRVHAT